MLTSLYVHAADQGQMPDGSDEAVSGTFQRTADPWGELKCYLAANGETDGASRWEHLENELKADRGLIFQDTLNNTGGSLTAALQANQLRLAWLKNEIEALKEEGSGCEP